MQTAAPGVLLDAKSIEDFLRGQRGVGTLWRIGPQQIDGGVVQQFVDTLIMLSGEFQHLLDKLAFAFSFQSTVVIDTPDFGMAVNLQGNRHQHPSYVLHWRRAELAPRHGHCALCLSCVGDPASDQLILPLPEDPAGAHDDVFLKDATDRLLTEQRGGAVNSNRFSGIHFTVTQFLVAVENIGGRQLHQRNIQMITDLGDDGGLLMIDVITFLRILFSFQDGQLTARAIGREVDNLVGAALCNHLGDA